MIVRMKPRVLYSELLTLRSTDSSTDITTQCVVDRCIIRVLPSRELDHCSVVCAQDNASFGWFTNNA